MSYGEAFALTMAIEVPLYVAGLRALRLAGTRRSFLAAVLVNVVTHPVLWWGLSRDVTMTTVLLAELAVCVVEGTGIRLLTRRDLVLAMLLAVGANAASFGIGLLVSAGGG